MVEQVEDHLGDRRAGVDADNCRLPWFDRCESQVATPARLGDRILAGEPMARPGRLVVDNAEQVARHAEALHGRGERRSRRAPAARPRRCARRSPPARRRRSRHCSACAHRTAAPAAACAKSGLTRSCFHLFFGRRNTPGSLVSIQPAMFMYGLRGTGSAACRSGWRSCRPCRRSDPWRARPSARRPSRRAARRTRRRSPCRRAPPSDAARRAKSAFWCVDDQGVDRLDGGAVRWPVDEVAPGRLLPTQRSARTGRRSRWRTR